MNAEHLFARYFLPLYPADAAADLERARANDANPAGNPVLVAHLADAARRFASNGAAMFGCDLALDGSDASVHRLGAALTRERRDGWAADGAAGTAENALFNVVVHGAAYVGGCIVAHHGGVWSVRRPLWESVVRLRSPAGEADLAVFHWWLKSLAGGDASAPGGDASAPGGGATLADRYRMHVEVPCSRAGELAPFVTRSRALPRLREPTYDRLHKYLRAHLPELRDVGADFPSAERFAAYALRWLDFHVVGGGRYVVLAGGSAQGLHVFWIGAGGFEKSVFMAGDAPRLEVVGDRLVATTTVRGEPQVREMLWWGL
jgi:hypothetical protein